MKRLFFFVSLIIVTSCSDTLENKLKNASEDYLQTTLKDPKSYEFIEFSILDTVFQPYITTEKGRELIHRIVIADSIYKQLEQLQLVTDPGSSGYFDLLDKSSVQQKIRNDKLDSLFANRHTKIGDMIGYRVIIRYRAKNGYGALDFGQDTLSIDKETFQVFGNADIPEIKEMYDKLMRVRLNQ